MRLRSATLAFILLLVTMVGPLPADDTDETSANLDPAESEAENEKPDLFRRLGFGVGVTLTRDLGEHDRFDGVAVDPSADVLGDGVEANKPLPEGEPEVRLLEKAQ